MFFKKSFFSKKKLLKAKINKLLMLGKPLYCFIGKRYFWIRFHIDLMCLEKN